MNDYLTFAEMKEQVGREIQDSSSSRRPTIVGDAINREYMLACRRYRWPSLSKARESTAATTANEPFLYLEKDVGELYFLRNASLGTEAVHQQIENFFRRQGLELDNQGFLWTYSHAGIDGKKAEISSAEQLSISSAQASSDNGKTAIVHGLVGVDEIFESVTIPGAGGVDTTNSFTDLYAVSIDGSQAGVITCAGKTSATTYATIAPGERTAKYKKLRLGMKPSDSTTVTYYFKKNVPLLTNDDQVPEIPAASALVELAAAKSELNQRHIASAESRYAKAQEALALAYDSTRGSEAIMQATPVRSGPYRGRGGRGRAVVVRNG